MIKSNTHTTKNSLLATQTTTQTSTMPEEKDLKTLKTDWEGINFEESSIPSLIKDINSNEPEKQCYGAFGLKTLLSNEDKTMIQTIIDSGAVPSLVKLMQSSPEPEIQIEAAWSLTNLCTGTTEQTTSILNHGIIPEFLSLLKSENSELVEQAMWGLGNITGDSSELRNIVLEAGGIEAIIKVLESNPVKQIVRTGIWVLSNLCMGKPEPAYELISKAIPVFCECIKNIDEEDEEDEEMLGHTMWSLASISKTKEGADAIFEKDINRDLVRISDSSNVTLIRASLNTIKNIISSGEYQASVILQQNDFLIKLLKLADHKIRPIRQDVFVVISRITAGGPAQAEVIMGNPAIVEKIIQAAKTDSLAVKIKAVRALVKSTRNCTPAQVAILLENGVFGCFIELLEDGNEKGLMLGIEGVKNCLKWGRDYNLNDENGRNKFVVEFENQEGVDQLESLLSRPKEKIRLEAKNILLDYFGIDKVEIEDT